MAKLEEAKSIKYTQQLMPWGQRVVRLYDPDQHLIEVVENMVLVVKRFLDRGLSLEKTAAQKGVSVEYSSL